MGKTAKFLALFLALLMCMSLLPLSALAEGDPPGDTGDVTIDETNFPDENFRAYVAESIDKNGDSILSGEEIANTTEILCTFDDIASLKGIEFFTGLTSLSCSFNDLTSLDVSSNTKLEELSCSYNQLTELTLGSNPNLTALECGGNQLTSLDLSQTPGLTSLDCGDNQLTELDLSGNPGLDSLSCGVNQLTSLDLSALGALTKLQCSNNLFTSLDLRKNNKLLRLECDSCKLTSLDVTQNGSLQLLSCSGNQLTSLDLSKNSELFKLNCTGNRITHLDISACGDIVDLVTNSEPHDDGGYEDADRYLYFDAPMELVYGGESHWIEGKVRDLAFAEIEVEDQVYTGQKLFPEPTVTMDGEPLSEWEDYTVKYAKNKNVGTATVRVIANTDHGEYTGTKTATFEILPAANEITAKSRYASYSAEAQNVKLGASATAGKLSYEITSTSDSRVKVTAKGTVKLPAGFVGTVKVKITATPKSKNYEVATKTVKVIVLKAPKLSGVTSGAAKKLTANWKKISGASGYEIQCSKKKDFSSAVKTVTARKAATTSKTIAMKAGNTKYFVRVRAYKVQDGVKYYSDWSNIKSVKVK